jgi:hypothetical protein
MRNNRHIARDSGYSIFFDKKSSLATGIGAAIALGLDYQTGASHHAHTIPLRSEWKAAAMPPAPSLSGSLSGQSNDPLTLLTITPDIAEQKWTEAEQARFRELAVQEAVGDLSADEAGELEQLTFLRRAYQNPRSGREVLWEFEQRRRTADLLNTLKRYVEFYDGKSKTRSGPA